MMFYNSLLPNRWCNPESSLSKQQTYMIIKQVGLTLKPSGSKQRSILNQSEYDKCKHK